MDTIEKAVEDIKSTIFAMGQEGLIYMEDGHVFYSASIDNDYPQIDADLLTHCLISQDWEWSAAAECYIVKILRGNANTVYLLKQK